MNLLEVKKIVFGGENSRVEFKRKLNHPEKVIREIVAFANSNGGHLFIGVDDDKTIAGLKYPEEEDYILKKSINELCKPEIKFDAEIIKLNEKKGLLHYFIFPSDKKPHFAFEEKHHRYGKAFVRVEDRSIQASKEMRKILKLSTRGEERTLKYGELERMLLRQIEEVGRTTVSKFQQLSGLPYERASNIIINMVLANVIRVIPRELEDWFEAVE
ncbi:MAG: putative HTH transcriptional regulator [Cyclobacteriaceae bacterium]|jgi:predicted HTH transcriptional regulator